MTSAYNQGFIDGAERAMEIIKASLSETHCDACKSPWRWDDHRQAFVDPFAAVEAVIEECDK